MIVWLLRISYDNIYYPVKRFQEIFYTEEAAKEFRDEFIKDLRKNTDNINILASIEPKQVRH